MSAILFFASMGLPGLCGFVGEFFVMMAAWNFSPALAIPAILERDPHRRLPAVDVAAGLPRHEPGDRRASPTCRPREAACLLPFVVLAIALGILPQTLIFNWVDPSVSGWVANLAVLR